MRVGTTPGCRNAASRLFYNGTMPTDPIFSKLKWRVAAKLPGPSSWDKMKVVNKGLSPLNKEQEEAVPNNPFLRRAWLRAFAKAGLPIFEPKTAAVPWNAMRSLWRGLRGSGAGTRSTETLTKRLGQGVDGGWSKLFQESARGGPYNSMTHQIGPAFGRAFGGAYIGHQFDSDDATPWGSMIGGLAGLSSPAALRKIFGNKKAPHGSLRRLFADRTISRRLANDPLNRVMLSAATGNLVDMGAGALGYDTGGWGERIGIMGGLAGGSRPLAQALAGRYRPVAQTLQAVGNTRTGRAFQRAQQGGYTYLPAYLLGSPYATGTGAAATMGMITHGALDATIGERVRNLAEKKKMLSSAMNTPEMEPAKRMMEQTLRQIHGPQARFYDPDGMPSKEAIHLIQQLGRYGMMQLQQAGHHFFGDSEYILNPHNWQRLTSPMSALGDFARGQATRINPLPF